MKTNMTLDGDRAKYCINTIDTFKNLEQQTRSLCITEVGFRSRKTLKYCLSAEKH